MIPHLLLRHEYDEGITEAKCLWCFQAFNIADTPKYCPECGIRFHVVRDVHAIMDKREQYRKGKTKFVFWQLSRTCWSVTTPRDLLGEWTGTAKEIYRIAKSYRHTFPKMKVKIIHKGHYPIP